MPSRRRYRRSIRLIARKAVTARSMGTEKPGHRPFPGFLRHLGYWFGIRPG